MTSYFLPSGGTSAVDQRILLCEESTSELIWWSVRSLTSRVKGAVNEFALHYSPNKPTALAFDPLQKIMAIGNRSGVVRLYGRPGVDVEFRHEKECAIRYQTVNEKLENLDKRMWRIEAMSMVGTLGVVALIVAIVMK